MLKANSVALTAVSALLGAAAISLGAWLSFPVPGTEIPQTGQTIAVLAVGALLGPVAGATGTLLYLLGGAAGLPVYSDGHSGWNVLFGPSAGYFAGFVLAATLTGVIANRSSKAVPVRALQLLGTMLLGHLVILFCGFFRLAIMTGMESAWEQGIAPFVYGGVIKSAIVTALVLVIEPPLRPIRRNE